MVTLGVGQSVRGLMGLVVFLTLLTPDAMFGLIAHDSQHACSLACWDSVAGELYGSAGLLQQVLAVARRPRVQCTALNAVACPSVY